LADFTRTFAPKREFRRKAPSDVGALADVFDRRGGHASIQEQLERRTQNPVAHLLLAHA